MGTPKGTRPWNYGTAQGWTDKRGYRWNYVTENGRRVARREHRVIMEQHLGRKLEPWELVHHKDGDKLNNDLANLEMREFGEHTAEHHKGGRKSEDARRSMEAFALLREELKRARELNAELLDALETLLDASERHIFGDECLAERDAARAVIAKARGEA